MECEEVDQQASGFGEFSEHKLMWIKVLDITCKPEWGVTGHRGLDSGRNRGAVNVYQERLMAPVSKTGALVPNQQVTGK